MKKKLSLLLACVLLALCAVCCAEELALPPVFGDVIEPVDYSNEARWLHLPQSNEHPVDVFFLYPTAWSRQEGEALVCEIDNASMIAGAQYVMLAMASVYEPVANLYAPYYRQIDASWVLPDGDLVEDEPYFGGVPYTDALAAFEYYLEHYNDGRPFILAGHSQGSTVTKLILKHYMKEHPDVYARMVAAYVIGYFVTEQKLKDNPHLKFAEGADYVGVIISWEAEAPGLTAANVLAPEGTLLINPITWTRTTEPAGAEQSLGSLIGNRMTGTVEERAHFADAAIDAQRRTLICSTADIDEMSMPGGLFPRGSYHGQDYGLYYYDLRANVAKRIEAYLENR